MVFLGQGLRPDSVALVLVFIAILAAPVRFAAAQEAGHFRQDLRSETLPFPAVERASVQDRFSSFVGSPVIQCPDWRSLVSPAVLRSASNPPPAGEFDRKLQQARLAGTANLSPVTTPWKVGDDGRRRGRENPAACTYIIRSGDTYGIIAARHLGSSKRWPDLVRANPGIDPNRLRVGSRINLPCDGTAGQGDAVPRPLPAAKPGQPLAGTSFLAALFGGGSQSPAASGAGKKDAGTSPAQAGKTTGQTAPTAAQSSARKSASSGAKVTTPTPASPAVPASPGLRPFGGETVPRIVSGKPPHPPAPPLPIWTAQAGEDFAAVLRRWGKVSGYRVVIGTTDAWTISVPVRIQASFEQAVSELVNGLGSDDTAPPVRVYSNKVLRLGGL